MQNAKFKLQNYGTALALYNRRPEIPYFSLLIKKQRPKTEVPDVAFNLYDIQLLYKFVIDSVEGFDEIILGNAYYDVKFT